MAVTGILLAATTALLVLGRQSYMKREHATPGGVKVCTISAAVSAGATVVVFAAMAISAASHG